MPVAIIVDHHNQYDRCDENQNGGNRMIDQFLWGIDENQIENSKIDIHHLHGRDRQFPTYINGLRYDAAGAPWE